MELISVKQVNNLLLTYRGEIITLRQAVAGGIVKAYLDSATENVIFVEIDPTRNIEGEMKVYLSRWTG